MLKTSRLDGVLRKFFPSISRLTYVKPIAWALNILEAIPRAFYPEFKNLPPNNYRVRIGVSNRFLSNASQYKLASLNFWMYCLSEKIVNLESNIVDIGVGCGRFAHPLRDMEFLGKRYTGHYTGIDIDDDLLTWCKANFDSERFSFHHSNHTSKSYVNQNGEEASYTRLPPEDGTTDLVFSTSLYSHLLEAEVRNYSEEAFRVLKPGGMMMMSVFCLDHPPPTYGNRHTFSHQMGNAYVESLAQPEAAVAYREAFLIELCKEIGFKTAEIRTAPGLWQPRLTCVK